MKTLIIILTLLVTLLGVISEDFSSAGYEVKIEEQDLLAYDRKRGSKHDRNYGLVVTGGDNDNTRFKSSEQISSMGVCVSPDTNIPHLPKAIAGAKSVWIEDRKILMFCGGSDTFKGGDIQKPDGWGARDKCYKLNPGDKHWKSHHKYKMIHKRSWFSLTNINEKEAVAAGGMTTGYANILDSMEKFSRGKWEYLRDNNGKKIKLKKATYGHCAVHFNKGRHSFLMIIGGSNEAGDTPNPGAITNAVTLYNLRNGKIKNLQPGQLPPLWAHACVIKGEHIYVSGGGDDGSTHSSVYKGTLKGEFKKIGNLTADRSGHTMGVTFKGQMIVAGGFQIGDTYLKQIESSIDGVKWNPWSTSLTEGGEYAAMASVPAFTFKCQGDK